MYRRKIGITEFIGSATYGEIIVMDSNTIWMKEVRGFNSPYTKIVMKAYWPADDNEKPLKKLIIGGKWEKLFITSTEDFLHQIVLTRMKVRTIQNQINKYNIMFDQTDYNLSAYLTWLKKMECHIKNSEIIESSSVILKVKKRKIEN